MYLGGRRSLGKVNNNKEMTIFIFFKTLAILQGRNSTALIPLRNNTRQKPREVIWTLLYRPPFGCGPLKCLLYQQRDYSIERSWSQRRGKSAIITWYLLFQKFFRDRLFKNLGITLSHWWRSHETEIMIIITVIKTLVHVYIPLIL